MSAMPGVADGAHVDVALRMPLKRDYSQRRYSVFFCVCVCIIIL